MNRDSSVYQGMPKPPLRIPNKLLVARNAASSLTGLPPAVLHDAQTFGFLPSYHPDGKRAYFAVEDLPLHNSPGAQILLRQVQAARKAAKHG